MTTPDKPPSIRVYMDLETKRRITDRATAESRALSSHVLMLINADLDGERLGDTAVQEVYRERSHLLALVASMAGDAWLTPASDLDNEMGHGHGWYVLFLYLQGGRAQCTWHISPDDLDLFTHIPRVPVDDDNVQWDGHSTIQKYQRIEADIARAEQRIKALQRAGAYAVMPEERVSG